MRSVRILLINWDTLMDAFLDGPATLDIDQGITALEQMNFSSERMLRRRIREDGYVAWRVPTDMVNVLVCAQFFIGGVYRRKRVFLVNRLLNWNVARFRFRLFL
ncbi:hypothetical protein Tco_1367629 [Tanacetum coccineum]